MVDDEQIEQAAPRARQEGTALAADADDTFSLPGKQATRAAIDEGTATIRRAAIPSYRAERRRSVLLILQGMDTCGKDSTMQRIFSGLQPPRCPTWPRSPSPRRTVWRTTTCRASMPPAAARLHRRVQPLALQGTADGPACRGRHRCSGRSTRRGRRGLRAHAHGRRHDADQVLLPRLPRGATQAPARADRRSRQGLEVRGLGRRGACALDEYRARYEVVMAATSTPEAPWFVIPADHKWVRDAVLLTSRHARWTPRSPAASTVGGPRPVARAGRGRERRPECVARRRCQRARRCVRTRPGWVAPRRCPARAPGPARAFAPPTWRWG